ncbi:hypothetical protein L195_g047121, partial [Trifolium pratense]
RVVKTRVSMVGAPFSSSSFVRLEVLVQFTAMIYLAVVGYLKPSWLASLARVTVVRLVSMFRFDGAMFSDGALHSRSVSGSPKWTRCSCLGSSCLHRVGGLRLLGYE